MRNADSRIHTVKMIKPTTKSSSSRTRSSVKLAPGMTAKFEVAFAADSQNDFWDKIVIQTEVGDAGCPCHRPPPECEPGRLDRRPRAGVLGDARAHAHEPRVLARAYRCDYDRTLGPALRVEPAVGSVPRVRVGAGSGQGEVVLAAASAIREQLEVFFDGKTAPFHSSWTTRASTRRAARGRREGAGAGGQAAAEMDFGAVLYGDAVTATCVCSTTSPTRPRCDGRDERGGSTGYYPRRVPRGPGGGKLAVR